MTHIDRQILTALIAAGFVLASAVYFALAWRWWRMHRTRKVNYHDPKLVSKVARVCLKKRGDGIIEVDE